MRVVDLFSGCGGLSLGFQKAGFEIVAAYENWDAAKKCYEKNFSDHPVIKMDLSDYEESVESIIKYSPDVIIGGPPCQDFSQAGGRQEGERASLTESFARIVCSIKPKFFIMENVDRARLSAAYANARNRFKEAGYGLTEVILDASLCGVPQKRKRFICFGCLGKTDGFAENAFKKAQSREPMTIRKYWSDQGKKVSYEYYYRHPRNYNRRGIFSIDEPAPTMRGVNRPVPDGYRGHPKDPCAVGEDLHVLSPEERAEIQTFPNDFIWVGSKTDVEQMIGNAVPVQLGAFVGAIVNKYGEM